SCLINIVKGTARRGEDGDQSKVRRQPKPIKPKKMIKVDGQFIVSAACNNGTTALVTRDGELLMFGKDSAHVDSTTGLVCNLKGEFVVQVALGKAHAVALTSKGQVYTFGINNKYQCGRDFVTSNKEGNCFLNLNDIQYTKCTFGGPSHNIVAMDTCGTQDEHDLYEEIDENRKDSDNVAGGSDNVIEPHQNMCPAGMHSWHDNKCMICTVCRECTGYSISCLSSMSAERNPGQECGCGEGDSGCSVCGCCRICAREVVDNSELADLAGMMRLDLIFRDKVLIPPRQRTKLQEQIQSRLEERKGRGRKSGAGPSKQTAKVKSIRPVVAATPTHRSNNTVYSFGSNLYGQLGCGDILAKNSIQLVKLPCSAIHVAAGSNHTVILTAKGEVYTFGNYQKSTFYFSTGFFSAWPKQQFKVQQSKNSLVLHSSANT
ncbi:RCC1 domain containing protein, partial [Asbolus verrucosus]